MSCRWHTARSDDAGLNRSQLATSWGVRRIGEVEVEGQEVVPNDATVEIQKGNSSLSPAVPLYPSVPWTSLWDPKYPNSLNTNESQSPTETDCIDEFWNSELMELMASGPPRFSHIAATPHKPASVAPSAFFLVTCFVAVLASSTTCMWITLNVYEHVFLKPCDLSDSATSYDFTLAC